MKDIQKLISVLEEQQQVLNLKNETSMANGVGLAIDIIKLKFGFGSQLEKDLEVFMEEDLFIPQEEYDDIFSYLGRCHDRGFLPDIDHLDTVFPETDWDVIEQEVKGFSRIHDLSQTKILWKGDLT